MLEGLPAPEASVPLDFASEAARRIGQLNGAILGAAPELLLGGVVIGGIIYATRKAIEAFGNIF